MQGWKTLQAAFHDEDSSIYVVVQTFIGVLIVLSIGIFIGELSVPGSRVWNDWLRPVDKVLLWFFVAEIVLRLATFSPDATEFYRFRVARHAKFHLGGRFRFAIRPMNIIDILAVLAVVPALRGLRALRLLRLLRGVRIFRHSSPVEGLGRAFNENRFLYAFAFSMLGLAIIVGGLSIFLVEQGENPGLQSVADGIWWAIVTLTTVGFGDIAPVTGLGRIVAGFLMVIGMFFLALFAGIVGNTMLHVVLNIREEQIRMSGHLNHVVLCGYDGGAHMLLSTLMEEPANQKREFIIFSPGERPPDVPDSFTWVMGDPTKESELEKVRLAYAAAVVVVGSRDVSPQQADAQTILTVFTIRRYNRQHAITPERQRPLYIVAEILEAENVEHARAAGCDEVIQTTRVGFSLLAHALVMPGTAEVMSQVASFSTHNLYVGSFNGAGRQTFSQLARELKAAKDVLLLGIREESGNNFLNPPADFVVEPGGTLLYLAASPVLDH